jgi:4-hydroxybenzoate polyprenyltransferase
MRAPAVFTALSNIVAAQLIVTEGQIDWEIILLLGVSSMCLYISGMILNDCFDYQEDLRDRPERPLPSGRIPLKFGWQLGWTFLFIGLGVAVMVGLQQLLIAGFLSVLIVFYNAVAKKQLYGFLIMGGCRYCNWLLGLSTMELQWGSFILAIPIFIYVSSLTLLSTIETTASNKKFIVHCGIGMLACALVIFYLQRHSPYANIISLLALVVGFWLVLKRLYTAYQKFSVMEIQQTIKYLVIGVIPLDALVVLSAAASWYSVTVLSLMIPGWFFARSLRVT